jgi:hypothetical protein
VVCHEAFVEVHHIVPQSEGGSDDLDNACPLCAYCHDLIGGNPDKRKQLRQMRDWWYQICEDRLTNVEIIKINARLDEIATQQAQHGALLSGALSDIKSSYTELYDMQKKQVLQAGSLVAISGVTGAFIPVKVEPPGP